PPPTFLLCISILIRNFSLFPYTTLFRSLVEYPPILFTHHFIILVIPAPVNTLRLILLKRFWVHPRRGIPFFEFNSEAVAVFRRLYIGRFSFLYIFKILGLCGQYIEFHRFMLRQSRYIYIGLFEDARSILYLFHAVL